MIIDDAPHSELLKLHRREKPTRDSREAGPPTRVRAPVKTFFSGHPHPLPPREDRLKIFTKHRFVLM